MSPTPTLDVHLTSEDLRTAMERDVRLGLTSVPKSLPPVYFYDDRGSQLFDEITRLPEYYPTRAERAILEQSARAIVATAGADILVELGAGTCTKSRLLLTALADESLLRRFAPLDVSDTTLWEASQTLAEEYPDLEITAIVGDFHHHLDRLPTDGRRLFAFLGGTIGNLDPAQRSTFYADLRAVMVPGDHFLLGTDLIKDRARLVAAYDDAAGVTAEFNRNVLHVLNGTLGATFDPECFVHVARFDEEHSRIEMRLRSTVDQDVRVADLDLDVHFAAGEEMLTEISTKFAPIALATELADAGFAPVATWTAPNDEFQLTLVQLGSKA